MSKFAVAVKKFAADESGATMIEYGLIVALISLAAIVALTAIGTFVKTNFETVKTKLDGAGT